MLLQEVEGTKQCLNCTYCGLKWTLFCRMEVGPELYFLKDVWNVFYSSESWRKVFWKSFAILNKITLFKDVVNAFHHSSQAKSVTKSFLLNISKISVWTMGSNSLKSLKTAVTHRWTRKLHKQFNACHWMTLIVIPTKRVDRVSLLSSLNGVNESITQFHSAKPPTMAELS